MLGNWWCKCYHFPSSLRRKVRDPCLQGLTVSSRIRSFFFFSFLFIYLFGCTGSSFLHSAFSSCGEQGLLSSCGAQASHCSSFSCCSSVQLLSRVWLFATPWIAALPVHHQLPESLKLMSIKLVMPSSHLILCRPLLLLLPIPPSIRVFSKGSTLRMRWPKYWSFSFSIIPSKEYPGLISFRMDWLDVLAVQVAEHGLNCSKAYEIFLDWLSNLCPLHWQADS